MENVFMRDFDLSVVRLGARRFEIVGGAQLVVDTILVSAAARQDKDPRQGMFSQRCAERR